MCGPQSEPRGQQPRQPFRHRVVARIEIAGFAHELNGSLQKLWRRRRQRFGGGAKFAAHRGIHALKQGAQIGDGFDEFRRFRSGIAQINERVCRRHFIFHFGRVLGHFLGDRFQQLSRLVELLGIQKRFHLEHLQFGARIQLFQFRVERRFLVRRQSIQQRLHVFGYAIADQTQLIALPTRKRCGGGSRRVFREGGIGQEVIEKFRPILRFRSLCSAGQQQQRGPKRLIFRRQIRRLI